MITNILLQQFPWTVWTRITPNCNTLCASCRNSVHLKPLCCLGPRPALWPTKHRSLLCWATRGTMGQPMLRSLLQDLSYLLYFPCHDMLLSGGGTQCFQSKLPCIIFPSQKHLLLILPSLPGRTLATPRSSTSSSFSELPLGFLLKPLSSGWLKKTFCFWCWENSNQPGVLCMMGLLLRITMFFGTQRRW